MKVYTHQQNSKIPSYALPYLINNDSSGLSQDDIRIIDRWLDDWLESSRSVEGYLVISPTGESERFTRFPEFGLPCMYIECDISILV
jgi:hypothetical protein